MDWVIIFAVGEQKQLLILLRKNMYVCCGNICVTFYEIEFVFKVPFGTEEVTFCVNLC
jgi:hypothetical protein